MRVGDEASVLCQLSDLPDGAARLVFSEGDATASVVLLRSGEEVHAFANRCPHFGVPLAKRQEHLIYHPHVSISCNNHYARFRWHDGFCEFGDCAGESLQPLAVELNHGKVCLKP